MRLVTVDDISKIGGEVSIHGGFVTLILLRVLPLGRWIRRANGHEGRLLAEP
jgi:hypothetical protein